MTSVHKDARPAATAESAMEMSGGPQGPIGLQPEIVNRDWRIDEVLSVSVESHGPGVALIMLSGELDMLTAPALRAEVGVQLTRHLRTLIIDLRHVTFLASAGLVALVESLREAETHGVVLRLVGTSHAVMRPVTAAGLGELLEFHESLDPTG